MARRADSPLQRPGRVVLIMVAAVAACVLLSMAAPAQPVAGRNTVAGSAAAQPEQQLWREIYAGLARRADLGDAAAARMALQMRAHGRAVYGMGFDASAEQLERWRQVSARETTLCTCLG